LLFVFPPGIPEKLHASLNYSHISRRSATREGAAPIIFEQLHADFLKKFQKIRY
jgi:hypothetical protein